MENQEPARTEKKGLDKFGEATRKAFHWAVVKTQRYTHLLKKRIDLAAIHRKIPSAHRELGKLVDDLYSKGNTNIVEHQDVIDLLNKLTHLRKMAASLEAVAEDTRNEEPPPPEENQIH